MADDLQLSLIVAMAGALWLLALLSLLYGGRLEDPQTPGLLVPGDVPLLLALGFTVAGMLPLVLRTREIRRLFREGIAVEATVEQVWQSRARTRVLYSFEYRSRRYERLETLNWNERAAALSVGNRCLARVDPAVPERAYLELRYL
ncbi:MAG TPA: DUF3592 domain-containing protein [Thermoleophilia bacterium]|nr:DUF3592 domain-containing protein [Thermoleophilia bacterium]